MDKQTLICSVCHNEKNVDEYREDLIIPCHNKECAGCGKIRMVLKVFEGHNPWACNYCVHNEKAIKNKKCQRFLDLNGEPCGQIVLEEE